MTKSELEEKYPMPEYKILSFYPTDNWKVYQDWTDNFLYYAFEVANGQYELSDSASKPFPPSFVIFSTRVI